MRTLFLLLALCTFQSLAADTCDVIPRTDINTHIDMTSPSPLTMGYVRYDIIRSSGTGNVQVTIDVKADDVSYTTTSTGLHSAWNVGVWRSDRGRTGGMTIINEEHYQKVITVPTGVWVQASLELQPNHMGNLEDGDHDVEITFTAICV